MSLRNVAGLYLVRMRGRVGQELLALLGIAVGVALLFAALVANSSLTGSYERLTEGVIGDATLQLSARGGSTVPERTLAEAQALPGVAHAAAVLQVRAEATGPEGSRSVELTGVTPELSQLGGTFTRGFSYSFLSDVRAMALPNPLVDALGLALGEPVTLTLRGHVVQARLGAKLQESDIGGMVDGPLAVAPLRYAQELAGTPGRVSRVFVVARPGREADVRRGLEGLAGRTANVLPADFDARLFAQASIPTNQSTLMFSVFGAIVGFLFAFSAMLLTAPQRRHLIADLDTEGYRPLAIVKVLLFDALALGTAASVLGIVLGMGASRLLFDDAPAFLDYAFVVGDGRLVTPTAVLVAAAGGVLASCAAVLGPTLSALLDLTREGGRRPAPRRGGPLALVAAGLVSLAAGIAVVVVAPDSAALGIAGLVALTTSMLLLLPAFLRLLVACFDRVTDRMRGVVPFMVSFDLRDRTALARSLAVAATGAVAVFASVALQAAHADLLRGLDRTSADVAGLADAWARAPGEDNLLMTTPFRAPQVRSSPAIAAVERYRGGFLDIGDRRVWVLGIPYGRARPLSRAQFLEGEPEEASRRLHTGGSMLLSAAVAREQGVHVGDRFALPAPVPTTLRVAAITTNLGWPPGAIVLGAGDYARAWGSADVSALAATAAPGASQRQAARALGAAVAADGTVATVTTAAEFRREQMATSRAGVARLSQIATLVLIAAVLAMATTMGGLIWQRRGFLAGVKVEGYGTGAMWKVLLLESGVLIGTGCVLGALFGLLGQGLLSRALTSVTGFPVVYEPAVGGAVLTCVGVIAAALAIVAVFGQRAADVTPESGLSGT